MLSYFLFLTIQWNVPAFFSKLMKISQIFRCQNKTGGFGGGPGQISHLAPTYAAINALAILGGEVRFFFKFEARSTVEAALCDHFGTEKLIT